MSTPATPTSSQTPRPLRLILWAIFLTSIASAFFPKSLLYLGLTRFSLTHWHLWTLFTYPFANPPLPTFNLLLHLAFNLFFLWVFGLYLTERMGWKRFTGLFFGAVFAGGIAATPPLLFTTWGQLLAGPSPALLALIVCWTQLHAENAISFGQHRALRPFWIFALFIGLNLAFDALDKRWISLCADAAGALFGYLFCLISERAVSTLSFLYPFEKIILRLLEKKRSPAGPKVYDFKTGRPIVSDDEFMDEMLARISLQGKDSITPEEQKRMESISRRKNFKLK